MLMFWELFENSDSKSFCNNYRETASGIAAIRRFAGKGQRPALKNQLLIKRIREEEKTVTFLRLSLELTEYH